MYPFDMGKIPEGLCQCGCGTKTNYATGNHYKCGYKKGEALKFVHGHNKAHWKGGRSSANGYVIIFQPDHPNADAKGYVYEHILIAEKALGKYLSSKNVVHHHTPEQLVVCENQSYHMFLHQRQRAFETCGNSNWLKCSYCHQYDDPQNLYISKHKRAGRHVKCASAYNKLRKEKLSHG